MSLSEQARGAASGVKRKQRLRDRRKVALAHGRERDCQVWRGNGPPAWRLIRWFRREPCPSWSGPADRQCIAHRRHRGDEARTPEPVRWRDQRKVQRIATDVHAESRKCALVRRSPIAAAESDAFHRCIPRDDGRFAWPGRTAHGFSEQSRDGIAAPRAHNADQFRKTVDKSLPPTWASATLPSSVVPSKKSCTLNSFLFPVRLQTHNPRALLQVKQRPISRQSPHVSASFS